MMRIVFLLLAAASITIAAQTPPSPTLSPPVTGGNRGQAFAGWPPASVPAGYVEEERFLSGTATAFAKSGMWGSDGQWATTAAGTAPYTIRLLIRRPATAKQFSGVVIVEWLNVTAQSEGAADFMHMQEEIVREGHAWVGVGAQAVGVNAPRTGLKAWDPVRYASLVHPGDAYSYDIFSQVAKVLRQPRSDALGSVRVRMMLATGRSQSAYRLVTYINAFHPATKAFDGYFVHSRGSNGAGLTAEALGRDADSPSPAGAHLRSDISVPILDVQTEGDMVMLRAHLTHQPASARYRRWEIAGGAHAETARWVPETTPPLDMGPGCKVPVNSAPHHAVIKAGVHALVKWVRDGVAPPQSPAIELGDPAADDPIVRDRFGNAKGGIRLPEVEAPTATIDGIRNDVAQATPGSQNFCFLFGRSVPLEREALASLYPSHDAFVDRFTRAVDALERAGYLLKPEADQARQAAKNSNVLR